MESGGEWGRLRKTGRDAESGGTRLRTDGGRGEWRRPVPERPGTPGRSFPTARWALRVLGELETNRETGRTLGLRGRVRRRQRRSRATHRWGHAGGGTGWPAGRGSRGDPRRPQSGLCERSRPELSEPQPGGAWSREEGREGRGAGAGQGPPLPKPGPGLGRPLVGSGRAPS